MSVQLLKFEAEWCGPCRTQADLLEDFDAVHVEPIDVDDNQMKASTFDIRSIPTLVLLVDGEEEQRWTGVTQPEELENYVETLNTDSDK